MSSAKRWPRFVGLLASALIVGALLGTLEGAVYPSRDGPRISIWIYWSILIATLFTALVAFTTWLTDSRRIALAFAGALVPLGLVVQDGFSLIFQGGSISTATWYAHFFGDHVFTRQAMGAPGFYYLFTAVSVVLVLLIGRPPPAPPRAERRTLAGNAKRSGRRA